MTIWEKVGNVAPRELRAARLLLDQGPRAERAGLLVGVQDHRPVGHVQIAALVKGAQRVQHDDEAALHIGRTRPESARDLGVGLERLEELEASDESASDQEGGG